MALNTQLGIGIGLSKVLMFSGIGLLIAGIATLYGAYQSWSKEQEKKNKLLKEEQALLRDANKNVSENAIKVKALESILKDSNKTYEVRNAALDELKRIMPTYNAQLSKEGDLIKDNTGALRKYVQELKNSALAKMYVDKFAQAQNDYDEWLDNLNPVEKAIRELSADDLKKTRFSADGEWKRLRKEEIELLKTRDKWDTKVQEFTEKDLLGKVPVAGTKAYWQKIKTDAENARDSLKDAQAGGKEWLELTETIKNAEVKLKTWESPTKADKAEAVAEKKAETAAEKILEAKRKLDEADKERQREKLSFDNEMRQREIDNRDDSFDKQLAQIKLNFDKEEQAIEEYKAKIAKAQYEEAKNRYIAKRGNDKGFEAYFAKLSDADLAQIMPEGLKPQDIAEQVRQLTDAAKAAQMKGLKDINKSLSDALSEQELMFSSDLDKKLAQLDEYYDEEIKKAENNANLIALLDTNRVRAKDEAITYDKIENINFKEQLEMEHLAGMESIGMTELVEEKKLEIIKRYLQLRIDELKPLADAGNKDAAKQIQLMQASLKKLDIQKPAKGLKALADKALFDKIKNGFMKAGDSAQGAEGKTIKLFNSISTKAATVANVANELQGVFGGLDEGLDKALSAVGNIADAFAKGGIAGGAMAAASEGLKLAVGIFSGAADNSKYNSMKEQYENLSDIWDELIAKKKEYISTSYSEEILQLNDEAKALIEKKDEDARRLGKERLNSRQNKGGSYWGSRQKSRITGADQKDIDAWAKKYNVLVDITAGRMEGLFDLTAEQLQKLKEEAGPFWAKMDDDVKKYLEDIIAGAEQIEAINKTTQEQWTQVSFDSVFDKFVDTLMDMDSSAEDFADNFAEYLQRAIVTSMVGEEFKGDLKDWYDDFSEYMKNKDSMTEEERERRRQELKADYDRMGEEAIAKRNEIAKTTGYTGDKESSRTGAKGNGVAASQDSVNELNGGIYALRQQTGDIRNLEKESLLIQRTQQAALDRIAENTEFCRYLVDVKNSLEDIQARGIKMRA